MADNVILPGTGAVVATDDVGGAQVQILKIGLGADGVIDTLLDSGQQLAANSVPVVLPADQITALTPLASITTLGTITNVVHVDDNGGTLTVDGTVTIQDGGGAITVDGTVTANTGLTQPLTDTQLRNTAVPVSVATIPSHAVTNAGTFKVQEDGAALTALQLIDNMISGSEAQVDIVGALPAGTALIGKVGIDQATANANEVVVKSGTVTAVTSITNAVTVNAHAVTNAGTFATQVDGAALTALQLIDNCISGSEAQVDVVAALPAGDNNIGNVDIVTGPTGANALQFQGTVASGSAAANNPVLNGAKAVSAEPAVVDENDVISLITDLVGKLITLPYANPENFISGTTAAITDTTRTSLIAAQAAGVRSYITQLTVTNAHATVGTMVKLEDNTTTIYQAYAPPGGGFVITFPVPLRGTAATAWNVSPVTTGASVIANASGYKGV